MQMKKIRQVVLTKRHERAACQGIPGETSGFRAQVDEVILQMAADVFGPSLARVRSR